MLDLYAGSGACGLEAASRGAARVDLVESDRDAVTAIARNRESLLASGVSAVVDVHLVRAEKWLVSTSNHAHYDVVFCDPPYVTGSGDVAAVLTATAAAGALAPDALVVLERSARDPKWQWAAPFSGRWDRRYGEAHLWIAALTL